MTDVEIPDAFQTAATNGQNPVTSQIHIGAMDDLLTML
jgi:hypothetical protein